MIKVPAVAVYFTSSDASLVVTGHPDPAFDGEVDAAFFTLTAGEAPIHIWNYARRGAPAGAQGGAPFDDTALSSHMAQLLLVLNVDRFRSLRYAFMPQTRCGDMRILYQKAPSIDDRVVAGYVLEDGYVSQSGQQITVGEALYATISIQFRRARPLLASSRRGEAAELEEGAPARPRTLRLYHATYVLADGTPRQYEPSIVAGRDLGREASLEPGLTLIQTTQLPLASTVEELPFAGAIVEASSEAGRELYAWGGGQGRYVRLSATSSPERPLVEASRLGEQERYRAQLVLFGGARQEELLWLSRAVLSETNDPDEQERIAWVIRNRAETGYLGRHTVRETVLAPYQFSAFNPSSPARAAYARLGLDSSSPGWQEALARSAAVLEAPPEENPFTGLTGDPTRVRHFLANMLIGGPDEPAWYDPAKVVFTGPFHTFLADVD